MKLRALLENPDSVYDFNNLYKWDDIDAIPFGYLNGKLQFGRFGDYHKHSMHINTEQMQSPGRLWAEKKIISFYTLDKLLSDIIYDINKYEKKYHAKAIKIDSNWKIDTMDYKKISKNPEAVATKWSILRSMDKVLKEKPISNYAEYNEYALDWENESKYRDVYNN